MKSIQNFLEEFNCIPLEEKPTILLQTWFKFFAIKHDQPEDSNELFQKLLEDLKELAEYKESLENYSKEIDTSNYNQENEEPPQDSGIRQLIKEECGIEVCEDQKQNIEDTILELVEICRQKELLCMHDNVDDLIESALNSKLLSINSQRLDKKKQEVKNVVEQPAKRGTQPEYSPSMGYENPNTTPEMESDEIIKSSIEELVPILSECEVTSEDKKECDMPVCENSTVCDDHSEIFTDFDNDDDISSDDDNFEDIEYVEASLPDPEIVSIEEENDVNVEEEEIIFRLNSKLFAIIRKRREVVTSLLMLMTLFPSMIRSALRLSSIRRGDISLLETLLIDDSIPINESPDSDFDNPSIPRPPPEPPDAEPDLGEEISAVMNKIDELNEDECFDPGESEDTIFDP
nr:hypothetical protein [Tanacetum cinerariifolium]